MVDWAIHSWDIRQATGRSHVMAADAADLIVPLAFVLWQYTVDVTPDTQPLTIGVRVSGRNGGTTRISVLPEGVTAAPGDVSDLPATLEFDPASFVLTAFGRFNGGTAHGDIEVADRFLNAIFPACDRKGCDHMTTTQTNSVDYEALAATRAAIAETCMAPDGERRPSTARGIHHVAFLSSDVQRRR